jgi:hypothetical protein
MMENWESRIDFLRKQLQVDHFVVPLASVLEIFYVMRYFGKYNVIVAWLLFGVLVMPLIAKPLHVCHHHKATDEDAHESNHSDQLGCDDCPMCHFILSPFVEAEVENHTFEVALCILSGKTSLAAFGKTPVDFFQLRAPPVG